MIDIQTNPLYYAAIGGLTIGAATSLNYTLRGKVTGMSGIIYGVATLNKTQIPQKISIIGGMLVMSGLFFLIFQYDTYNGFAPYGPKEDILQKTSYLGFALAGLLVGFGTKLSNGCTSGHGLCGLARFSIRSLIAVSSFLATGIAISTLRHYVTLGPFSSQELNPLIQYNHTISASFFMAIGLLLPILGGFYKLKLTYQQRDQVKKNQISQSVKLENQEQIQEQLEKNVLIDQLIAFIVGIVFGLGLLIAGMVRRVNLLSFLEMGEGWNPSLLFVLGCGILVNLIFFTYMRKIRKSPFFSGQLFDPNNNTIDIPLVLGAVCFGLGWGIGGICPGPAIMLMSVWNIPIHLIWFATLLIGMFLATLLEKRVFSKKPQEESNEAVINANQSIANCEASPDINVKQSQNKQEDTVNTFMVRSDKKQKRHASLNENRQNQKIISLKMVKVDEDAQIRMETKLKPKLSLVEQSQKQEVIQMEAFNGKEHTLNIEDF